MNYNIQNDIQEIIGRIDTKEMNFSNKTILVTGGAGFLGSWVCDVLVKQGTNCVCLDNMVSGRYENIEHLMEKENFQFINHDITEPIYFGHMHHPGNIYVEDIKNIDIILHMASRASPFDYSRSSISILKSNTLGTMNALGIAKEHNAIFCYTSSSEVYGSPPREHIPTPESYFGHVNPVSPRSCYNEAKRTGEAFIKAYELEHNLKIKIIRIFNTFGPRARSNKVFGRVVSRFITQALNDREIIIFGDGTQTRTFAYVVDTITGILKIIAKDEALGEVINLGSKKEISILELAETIIEMTNSNSKLTYHPLPTDDPRRRNPDLTKINELINWENRISLKKGLENTIKWFVEN